MRQFVCLIIALFILGQCGHLIPFLQHGRGEYRKAMAFMNEQSPHGATLTSLAPRDAILALVLQRFDGGFQNLKIIDATKYGTESVEWMILFQSLDGQKFAPIIWGGDGVEYHFKQAFPTGAPGLSGVHWGIYAKAKPTKPGPIN